MSAAPAKKSAKKTTATEKTAAKKPTAARARPQPKRPVKADQTTSAKPKPAMPNVAAAATASTPDVPTSAAVEVCPRCGTTKFGPEERTRWEARRTVRYTVLVCERGHTFAHPVTRAG